jgi:hypothetical protein
VTQPRSLRRRERYRTYSTQSTTIQQHLRSGARRGERGWEAGEEDEDVLTGDLGSSLRREWSHRVQVDGSSWRWRVTYRKFRGRGRGAAERMLGADGIFQVEIENLRAGVVDLKGILFQAKKNWQSHNSTLVRQIQRMERLSPGATVVFNYTPDAYYAIDGPVVLSAEGNPKLVSHPMKLGDYLADSFLPCNTGLRGLYYDSRRRLLIVPRQTVPPVISRIPLLQRITVEVEVS